MDQLQQLQAQLADAHAVIDSYAQQFAIMGNGNIRLGADLRKRIAELEAKIAQLEKAAANYSTQTSEVE